MPSAPYLIDEWAARDEPQGFFLFTVGRVCVFQTMETMRSKESKGLATVLFNSEKLSSEEFNGVLKVTQPRSRTKPGARAWVLPSSSLFPLIGSNVTA